MTQINVNGLTIEYETRGSGEPMLLVMGLGAQMIAWPDDFIDEMVARGFKVIWFDNRDIGLSSKIDAPVLPLSKLLTAALSGRKPKAAYDLDDMAADAIALLDALGIDRFHVAGVSMGGMISQTLAIAHPERVISLTSIMSNTGDKRHGLTNMRILGKLRRLMSPTPDEAIESQVSLFKLIGGPLINEDEVRTAATLAFKRDFDRDGVSRQLSAIMASPNRTTKLGQVKAPTLVIHGLSDKLVGYSGGITTAKAVPGARLLMFPDMGHDLPRSLWPEMIDAIVANSKRATLSS